MSAEASRALAGGLLRVVLSGVCFGSLGVLNRLVQARGVDVPTALALRFGLAAGVLWLLLALGRRQRTGVRQQLPALAAMGALFALEAGLFFVSSRRIPVALTTLLLYLFPAWVALAAWAGGAPMGRRGAAALALALGGIGLAVGFPRGALDPLGLALGAASSLGYAATILLGARVQRALPALEATAWVATFAAVLLLAAALSLGSFHPARALAAWPGVAALALVGTVLPTALLLDGLRRLSATQAAIASTVEPIAGAALAALVLGERLAPLQVAGGALVLAAVVLLGSDRRRG